MIWRDLYRDRDRLLLGFPHPPPEKGKEKETVTVTEVFTALSTEPPADIAHTFDNRHRNSDTQGSSYFFAVGGILTPLFTKSM